MKKICLFLVLCFGFSLNAQIINFPDINFKTRLLQASPSFYVAQDFFSNDPVKIDINNDGEIQVSEALLIRTLNLDSANINSLVGITEFTNLVQLSCEINNLSALNLQGMNNLTHLSFSYNNFSTFDFSYLTGLIWLRCNSNPLTSLNLNGLTNLYMLQCTSCQLTSIDLSPVPNLTDLYCYDNNLTTIDVSAVPNLVWLNFQNCNVTNIDLSNLIHLRFLVAGFNQLTSLDANNSPELIYFLCQDNPQLTSIFLKNGSNESDIFIQNNPNLTYICADESQFNQLQTLINQNNYTNCFLNSYCSFGPGGINYFFNGNCLYDLNNNGCDSSDTDFSNINLNITNGITSGTFISNNVGSFSIPLEAGSYTVTPQLENPNFFIVSPANFSFTFPMDANTIIQNFCIQPNGIHNDLEITLIPLNAARPGFDSNYKIVYKNKGTHTQSGNVTLAFEDSKMDFVSSNPNYSSLTTNLLTWDYSNLLPFETREIAVSFNINTPLETTAVNIGDQLDFTAIVNPIVGDEIAIDNTSPLKQIVVGSYDPNDKTCIEGTVVSTSVIGNYVHYLIRFENTGNYAAQNVVVKDIIDTTKFIVSTIVPISSSHPMTTKYSSPNKLEFFFENINLPFDDANNDGYVAFKIKTKSTLVTGNTFSNTANIYFDYNAPIITNTATSTIQTLSNQDFEFSNYFTVAQNPVKNVLNIQAKLNIDVTSISIYNTLGQLILVIPSAKEIASIDVSSLTSGTYFIKVVSDKGSSNAKFIKE